MYKKLKPDGAHLDSNQRSSEKPPQKKGFFTKFGFSENSKVFATIGSAIDSGLYILLTAIGTIALAFGGGLVGSYNLEAQLKGIESKIDYFMAIVNYPLVWMIVGGILFIIGSIGTFKDHASLQNKIASLELENKRIPELSEAVNSSQEIIEGCRSALRKLHTDLVTTHLKAAYKSLGLSTHDRVSIYYEYANDFHLLARHSQNPVYAKSHRQKFPLNQGVISQAWQHQLHIEKDCPSYSNESEYLDYMEKKYGYEKGLASGFAMKSCRYVAIAISDADSHTGVIVFESTSEDFLTFTDDGIEKPIINFCSEYQGIHSKFLRDGLELNRETHIQSAPASVELEFLESFNKEEAKSE